MTQPKIQIKLTTEQLQNLIPPGSEMELALSSGCIENYTDRLTKRVVDKLVGRKEHAIFSAIEQAEKQVATKEWYRASATLSAATKEAIKSEVKAAAEYAVRTEISSVVKEYISSDSCKQYVNSVVEQGINAITKQALDDLAKTAIKEKLKNIMV